VANDAFRDQYFAITYALPEIGLRIQRAAFLSSGHYVLAQLSPADIFKGAARGSILITAQDMFFTPVPAMKLRT
jgi:hypothetical protein